MIGVPDFTDKEFDNWDNKTREKLTESLRKIQEDATSNVASTEVNFPKGMIFYIVDDPTIVIPKGYKKADGTNQTFDVNTKTLIPIQRV